MGKHDDDNDTHKPEVDPSRIARPGGGSGGKHGGSGTGGGQGKGGGTP